MNRTILYLISATTESPYNTGVEKVVKSLAKAMIANNEDLIPVDFANGKLTLASESALLHLKDTNGPQESSWGLGSSREQMQQRIYNATHLLSAEMTIWSPTYKNDELVCHCRENNIKTAFIFYDAIPIILEKIGYDKTYCYNSMSQIALSDFVFPISNASAKDYIEIVSEFDSDSTLAEVITVSLATELLPSRISGPKKVDPNDIHIAYVSSFDIRKNHEYLYNAFEIVLDKIKHTDIKLTLHAAGTEYRPNQADGTRKWAELLPMNVYFNCTDETIHDVYANSDFTVYPSLYEGFGLPVIESLIMNTPVLAASSGGLREVAEGGGCVIFDLPEDRNNFDILADEIFDLVTNPSKIEALQKEIPSRKIKTWVRYAKEISEALV